MKSQLDDISYIEAEKAITDGVVNDLNNFLSAIKGRAYLMKHSVHGSNPIQKHLDEIIHCVDKSIETADLLSSFVKVNESFELTE